MRILFTIRDFGHFSYVQSVVEALSKHRVVLLFDKEWCRYVTDEYIKQCGFRTDWMITQSPEQRIKESFWRELRSYASYIKRNQSVYYLKRWESYLPKWVRYFRPILPYLPLPSEDRKPLFEWATKDLIARQPDVVVATPVNHRFSGELEYVKAAKELGIPTVGVNQSWDNLTTKGLFHVAPDLMLVWNETQKKEAIEIHDISKESIEIIGAPFFDKWFQHRNCENRKKFCKKVGLDHKRPFVLYLGSSSNIAENETWLIEKLYDKLDIGMLVRPHPANTRNYIKLAGKAFIPLTKGALRIKDDFVVYPIGGELPEDETAQQDFYNALKHCVCVIGINTSGMIDAVINGKPVVSVMSDEYRLTQSEATHFKQMADADILETANTTQEAVEIIKSLARGEDNRWESRRQFVRKFIRPRGLDRMAGELAAERITPTIN
jgi:hypothetical protein